MITIKTRLDSGIYKSSGGGEIVTRHQWANGPRNLLVALLNLRETRADNESAYGNIGCGRTWLEIDGMAMEESWIDADMQSTRAVLANVSAYSQDAAAKAMADIDYGASARRSAAAGS